MININSLEVLPNEIWKLHEESELAVSNLGRVFISKNGNYPAHYTYGCTNNRGYKLIRWKNKNYSVHRLVAQCFLENPDNLPTVDHINRDKTDNRAENLRWADMKLQCKNRIHPKNDAKSKQVMQIDTSTNEVIRIWSSTQECRRNGFHSSHISDCCLGKQNTHKGYKWQYA